MTDRTALHIAQVVQLALHCGPEPAVGKRPEAALLKGTQGCSTQGSAEQQRRWPSEGWRSQPSRGACSERAGIAVWHPNQMHGIAR